MPISAFQKNLNLWFVKHGSWPKSNIQAWSMHPSISPSNNYFNSNMDLDLPKVGKHCLKFIPEALPSSQVSRNTRIQWKDMCKTMRNLRKTFKDPQKYSSQVTVSLFLLARFAKLASNGFAAIQTWGKGFAGWFWMHPSTTGKKLSLAAFSAERKDHPATTVQRAEYSSRTRKLKCHISAYPPPPQKKFH